MPDDGSGPGLLGADLGGDGAALTALHVPPGERYVSMDGQEVYPPGDPRPGGVVLGSPRRSRRAVADDVDLFVPHQANARIIEATAGDSGIPAERVVVDVDRYGNTSAASVPIALGRGRRRRAAQRRHPRAAAGIGAGMAWASLYLRWGS